MFSPPQLVGPIVAFLIGVCALRIVRRVAPAVGFVDNPDRWRKLQEASIPLGGGIAVWLATWLGWLVSRLGRLSAANLDTDAGGFVPALAFSSSAILVLGIVDDRYGLRARRKLAGQVIAALILVGWGLPLESLRGFGLEIRLGIFAFPVAVAWVVLVINAFNLVDGMDGFCGSLALVSALGITVLAHRSGRIEDTILVLALAGGLAAFLKDNYPPAKIYLGDAGSMTLGLMLSGFSLRACSDRGGTAVSFAPLLGLLSLPLLDVVTAVGRRSITGRSIFTPDRGHLHHCLRTRLGNTVAALAAAMGLAAIGAAGAVLAKTEGLGDLGACLAIAVSVGLLVGTNTFGRSESRLLWFRARTALLPFLGGAMERRGCIKQACHLHGKRDWAEVWDALILRAEDGGLTRVELAIDLPAAGEVYHGLWVMASASAGDQDWTVVHTLHTGGVPAGVLQVAGYRGRTRTRDLARVEEMVRLVEGHLVAPPAAEPARAADPDSTHFSMAGCES